MLSFESFRFASPGKRPPGESQVTPSRKRAALVVATASAPKSEDLVAMECQCRRDPFVAPEPALWRERDAPVCVSCEANRVACAHTRERPLKLLVCGHNPSDHSWSSGYSYSNPSNNFWKLLVCGSIIPNDWTSEQCPLLQESLGIGFTDAGTEPGNDASKYGRAVMLEWRSDLYARMRGHLCRVAVAENREDDATGDADDESRRISSTKSSSTGTSHKSRAASFTYEAAVLAAEKGYGPCVVAFAGKRQYAHLFDAVAKKTHFGLQDPSSLPQGWPFRKTGPGATEVWVLPSSSGRAVMTKEAREGPYLELGERLREVPWPSEDVDELCEKNNL